jgi:adenylylsulfate kinase
MNKINTNKKELHISREARLKILGYENMVFWFTGLSGSGKSTLGRALENKLFGDGIISYVLDGDEIRIGINKDLDFSINSRKENIRRIGEISKILYESGIFVIACFISPLRDARDSIRKLIGKDFIEIFVKCNLAECEKRDPKGLYKKVRKGFVKEFTGISSPYEEPEHPELIVDTEKLTIEESIAQIYNFIKKKLEK